MFGGNSLPRQKNLLLPLDNIIEGEYMKIEKIVWEYYDDDKERLVQYHDESYTPGTGIEEYIEALFDLSQIDSSERDYLMAKYVTSPSGITVANGKFILQFEVPESESAKKYKVARKQTPPPPKPTKSAVKGKPKPPPPPPPKSRPKPRPEKIHPTPSPAPKRLFRYKVPVFCTQNSKKWNCMVQSEEKPKQFEQAPQQRGANVEISFLIDTSGSMTDKMEAVKQSCLDFARTIEEEGANVRLALTGYGIQQWGSYTTKTWQLMDAHSFQQTVNEHLYVGLCGGGGCNVAESGTAIVFDEVISVFSTNKYGKSSDATRYIIHISDEYDYSGDNPDLSRIITICKDAEAVVHTMGRDQPPHVEISAQTGGEFWDIESTRGEADLNGILESVSQSIAHSVSLSQTSSKVIIDGPQCTQYNSSILELASGSGDGRSTSQELKENEGYIAIRNFNCMYCEKDTYFVCNFCGEHNCRGTETPVTGSSDVVAESSCQSCGKQVKIVQETSVESVIQDGVGGKKGK
jgi:hypothetical protein